MSAFRGRSGQFAVDRSGIAETASGCEMADAAGHLALRLLYSQTANRNTSHNPASVS
jgi:hypothetical protein